MRSDKGNSRLDDLKTILSSLIEFLEPFKNFLNTHNVQFIVDDHWSNNDYFPQSLSNDLESFIDSQTLNKPESTVNLIKHYHEFDESKLATSELERLFLTVKKHRKTWTEKVLTPVEAFVDLNNEAEFNFDKMRKQNRFMKEKKVHEVDIMSRFVALLCKKLNIETIVDVGSGRAYLSAQLSSSVFDSCFNVIAIDSQSDYVQSSLKRLDVMKRKTTIFTAEKKDNFTTFDKFIQSNTHLNELIDNYLVDSSNRSFALIGLHSCGNLSNSIVNLFLTNKDAKTSNNCKLLCNVACCYNLLNEKYASDPESSKDIKKTKVEVDESSKFPMSALLNEKRFSLNFNARMIACHSLEKIEQSLDDFRELTNTSLWYRCVLQVILLSVFKEEKKSSEDEEKVSGESLRVGRKLIKDKSMPGFVEYVRKAIEKMGLNNDKISDEEILSVWNRNLEKKFKFDVYIQLKIILSPLVEYLILLDRLIYLHEKESVDDDDEMAAEEEKKRNHFLVKLFDAAKSPRCHAILSFLD